MNAERTTAAKQSKFFNLRNHLGLPPVVPGVIVSADSPEAAAAQLEGWLQLAATNPPSADDFTLFDAEAIGYGLAAAFASIREEMAADCGDEQHGVT